MFPLLDFMSSLLMGKSIALLAYELVELNLMGSVLQTFWILLVSTNVFPCVGVQFALSRMNV